MKKTLLYVLSALLLLACYACENNSYAHKREMEKKDWENYVLEKNLEISEDSAYCFGDTVPWPENRYFKTERGAFLRMIKDNPEGRKVEKGNTVIIRFVIRYLDGSYSYDNLSPNFDRDGYKFVYRPGSQIPSIALIDICPYIHHGSEFEVIIDSKLGDKQQMSEVRTWKVEVKSTTVTN